MLVADPKTYLPASMHQMADLIIETAQANRRAEQPHPSDTPKPRLVGERR